MNAFKITIKELFNIPKEQTISQYFYNSDVQQSFLKILLVILFVGGVLLYTSIEIKESAFLSKDIIFGWLYWFGPWAWVLYLALLVVAVMSPIPDSLVILAGGFFFGPIIGSILTIIGQGLGAIIDFLLARRLGRDFVKAKFPNGSLFINKYSHKLGWQTVFLMRLFPTVSFDMLSYIAGISELSFRKYVLATIGGLIPLAIITTMLGHSANLHSSRLALLSLGIGVLSILIISIIFFYFSSKRKLSTKTGRLF
jgi:uncharacterized membrane protein YdjX (TVP38/TMEM64 family)